MKRWILGIFSIVVVLILSSILALYQFGGLKQYIKVVNVINKMQGVEKDLAWDDLLIPNKRGGIKGVLAGTLGNLVWIWNRHGLQLFIADENSVYSFFDGCSEEVMERLKKGEKDAINRSIYTDIREWNMVVKPGEYVTVYTASEDESGSLNNLREIYGYNFWLFMNKGMDIACAK